MPTTKKVFFSGVHGVGKSSLLKATATALQKAGLSAYIVPEMTFPFIAKHGTMGFQLRYKKELEVRESIIDYIVRMEYFDYVLCDRDMIDVDIYTARLIHRNHADRDAKIYPERSRDSVHVLITCDPKIIIERLNERNKGNGDKHRKEWGEIDLEYIQEIQELFMKATFHNFFDAKIDNIDAILAVDKILSTIYF